MEKPPQSFDVCIVCALPEEVRVFLEIVRQQGEGVLEEHISPRYHYSYRFTTIKNTHDESLNLHISWLPRYGPQEMTLHLLRVLEECQPRMAIMTGICAGDSQQVQLGDLVVAERTFTFDNGKFTLDEHGRSLHLHDTLTYQLDANILQFLGLFDDWKPLVACLKRPPSSPERRKRRTIMCHIKAMASCNAVRSDNPFEDVRAPVRGTVAIDMEGAAFGLVMSHHPLIRWLEVKGVCDYADRTKNDAYHDYAARVSALYALGFIRAYVTNERLPRLNGPSSSSRAGPPGVWNIPFARNPFFTGREREFTSLHTQLQQSHTATVGQPQAISGLGGIGKTQLAVEYAYRYRQEYQAVLWARADTTAALNASYTEIAMLLQLPQKDAQDQEVIVQAVKNWLRSRGGWLLILDNADDLDIVQAFLPTENPGHLLLTTRAQIMGKLARRLEVETLDQEVGALLLLRRAGLVARDAPLDTASSSDHSLALALAEELGGLPLALDQAGAYIEETQCRLADYQQQYQTRRAELLALRGRLMDDHPEPVATTWSLSFAKVEQASPIAAELLRACAFLAPDAIPEELLVQTLKTLTLTAESWQIDDAVAVLRAYSLLKRNTQEKSVSVHRLVQAVLRDAIKEQEQLLWITCAVSTVAVIFPAEVEFHTWGQCARYLPQALMCARWIAQRNLMLLEGASLLDRAGIYLCNRGQYQEVEPLFERALEIRERQLGAMHPDTVQSLNNLAGLYREQGRYGEAEPLYQRALETCEQQLGAMHPDTAQNLNDLALLYDHQGKYVQAELFYERALAIYEQHFGPEHSNTATSLSNLANLYGSQGKHEQAELLSERSLAIREQHLGREHPDTANSLTCLALIYKNQGKHEQAEPLYKRALAIYEQHLGPEHPDTATVLNNLAALYDELDKHEQAEPLYERTLAIYEQHLGPEHPDIATSLSNLALLYQSQEKYKQAESLFEDALSISERRLGRMHPSTAVSLNNLAALYESQAKYKQAEPLYERALAIFEQILGQDHPNTVTVRENYAILLQKLDQDEEKFLP